MDQITGRWRLGLFLALSTALMWGLLPIALKGVLGAMDAITITWFRFFVSALLIGAYIQIKGGFPWRKLAARSMAIRFAVATVCLLGNFLLYLMGLDYTTASAAQVMIQVAPMLMLLLSLFLFNERFSVGQAFGVLLFVTGLLLFFNLRLEELLGAQGRYAFGVLLVFVAALIWAVYGVIQKQLHKSFTSMEILWLIFVVGAVVFAPKANFGSFQGLGSFEWICLIFAALNTIVAYGTFAYALQHWEASRVSATITLVPVITLLGVQLTNWLWPALIVVEPMNLLSWIGASLVVVGSMAAALLKARTRRISA
ncbi:DMT family transporter [Simiduia curdlanivorans]|uniref:DMT family transporter n=1 Tax=Simiduia curdlanivorans TaxID=1492769 RepID=A0ABV8V529_9GAMM|nr:DMT family transporter [Simiduia curdlanivorans]MDN3638408.1 DMT family transporter [Simiduia curdlanivorans]